MDYYLLESKHQKLLGKIRKEHSPRTKFIIITGYIESVFNIPDQPLQEAFLADILFYLNNVLKNYNPFGLHPDITNKGLSVIEKVLSDKTLSKYLINTDLEIKRIKGEVELLDNILSGENYFINNEGKFAFPLLESGKKEYYNLGVIDSLEVTLNSQKELASNIFILYPSAIETDELLKKQLENSWQFAQKYFTDKYSKKIPNFEIIISFEKKYGIYTGNSLGIALTTAFIAALCNHFEIRENVSFVTGTISTGEVRLDGTIPPLSKKIVETKINTAFFSTCTKFILPQKDEDFANKCLAKLKQEFPKRELEIIGVKYIKDIFNRRDLIDQKKTNIAIWSVKKVLTNKLSTLLLILLIITAVSFYFWNYDDNPMDIEYTGNEILIKNKYDKILWHLPLIIGNKTLESEGFTFNNSRIIDIDNDQVNEVLIAYYSDSQYLTLFNNKGETIWEYAHIDSIESGIEKFTGMFTVKGIVDTLHRGDITELIVYFQHHNYFPSGIVKLNLKTGEEISDILWHPGGIASAILLDWNGDGTKEIIAGGATNGMHSSFAFSIDENKLLGTFPTSNNYYFKDFELADFNHYIIIRQTDYGKYFFPKYSAVTGVGLKKKLNYISLSVGEGKATLSEASFKYSIRIDKKFKINEIIIADASVMERDRKIQEGILTPPLTDTPEFHNSLLRNIEYWNGERFVKFFPKIEQQ